MMGLIGRLLATPVRLVNVPARTIERVVDSMCGEETPKKERILSGPLESLAEAIEEAVDGED